MKRTVERANQPPTSSQFPSRKGPERRGPKRDGPGLWTQPLSLSQGGNSPLVVGLVVWGVWKNGQLIEVSKQTVRLIEGELNSGGGRGRNSAFMRNYIEQHQQCELLEPIPRKGR